MSQYSFFLAKKKKVKYCKVIFAPESRTRHYGYELDKVFGIKYDNGFLIKVLTGIYILLKCRILSRLFPKIGIKLIYEPKNYDYDEKCLGSGFGWLNFYVGGWHSEKYFNDIRSEILKVFHFPQCINDTKFVFYQEKLLSSNAVSIHIRRGDYLNVKPGDFYQYCGVATLSYYKKAIIHMRKYVDNPVFFIFSNDLDWCRKMFNNEDFIYVDCNLGENSWKDLYLISLCRYHINANSTFSWWGAWLCNKNHQITVCPSYFLLNVETKDFYPQNWIKLSE